MMKSTEAEINQGAERVAVPAPPKRITKHKSSAWDHFVVIEGSNPKRAACKYCQAEYGCDGRRNGTSNLLTHIKVQCKKYPYRLASTSQHNLTSKLTKNGNELVSLSFSLEACRKALTKMIIVDELPFCFVEGQGFRDFCHTLQPRFTNIPMRTQMQRDCIKLYFEEKEKLKYMMRGLRISLTTDTWTSIQNLSYMCLTAHFVDKEWVLQKRILNFCQVPNHKGETIGKIVEKCLLEWGIEIIFIITVDNASSNNVMIDYLRKNTKHWKGTILGHKHLHMRCGAHILNLIVSEGLAEVDESVVAVRNAIRYVRSSPSRLKSFKTCVDYVKIDSKKLLCLDVPTRWNSTYMMLEAAEKFQLAFDRMEGDSNYMSYFEPHGKKEHILGPPISEDWDKIRVYVKFFRVFFNATLRISGSRYVTSNVFFSELFFIERKLASLGKNQDILLSTMARNMQTKFDRYWSLGSINMLLYVAVVLDPRRKLDYVSFFLDDMFDKNCSDYEKEEKKRKAKKLKDKVLETLSELFESYKGLYSTSDCTLQNQNITLLRQETGEDALEDEYQDVSNLISHFQKHMEEKDDLGSKSELDRYLLEGTIRDEGKFNILEWWKSNTTRYRVLSCVARDILAVPVSSVASESAFSTACRILDPFRSCLAPNTVEALICAQDWLRSPSVPINLRESMDEVEQFDIIDAELFGSALAGISVLED